MLQVFSYMSNFHKNIKKGKGGKKKKKRQKKNE